MLSRSRAWVGTPPLSRLENGARRGRSLILGRNLFQDVLGREHWRADRFDERFTLFVITLAPGGSREVSWQPVLTALSRVKRPTDVLGWLETGKTLGLILPDAVSSHSGSLSEEALEVRSEVEKQLGDLAASSSLAAHRYELPRSVRSATTLIPPASTLKPHRSTPMSAVVKRAFDAVVGAGLLVTLTPLLAVIALLIKVKSRSRC
jgi:hypothetical protein